MFERNKKEDHSESQDFGSSEPEKTFGANRKSKPRKSDGLATIGRSIQISGDLRGDEDLRIEGDVSGTVELRNNALTIGKEGMVHADVYARSIAVDGETRGDLYATERVSVHVNARVQGNIISPRVSIEEGAHFKGSIEMDQAAVEKVLGKPAPENKAKPEAAKAAAQKSAKESSSNLNPPAGTA
ncbi:MAG: polymer-forming cytoskeletal protein [Woeseiaceae bacterium]|nr:polymer-forming cytoskeletal protein [Woeseiaceae bacterium]